MLDEIKLSLKKRKEFYEKYLNKIVPVIRKHETARKNKLILAIVLSSTFFVCSSILLYIVCTNGGIFEENNDNVMKIIIMLYSLSYFSWYLIKKKFENTIKEKIMPTVCSCIGNLKWSHEFYCGGKVFMDSFVVSDFTIEEYDDIFKGIYNDVKIEIIEPEYRIKTGRNSVKVFDGVIVKLDMNKNFKSHTVIKPNGLLHFSPSSKLHFTELEDPEFNRQFDVYTDDEVDARYLITPSFMERLKDMEVAFKANNISCAFYRKHLIIALHTNKDLFSICSLVKPIDDEEQYFQMYEEIVSIIKLIDHFKLNQKIGL